MSNRKPDISLLAVNKAINAEAAEIFYGKNVWVINQSFKDDGPQEWGSQAPMDEIWHIHRNQIRHVNISLNPNELEVDIWSLAMKKAYQLLPEKTTTSALVESAHMHRVFLLMDASRWKMNVCRELEINSLTIDIPLLTDLESFPSAKVIWRYCLDPLLDWVRSDEETRFGEPDTASVRSSPKITLTGCPDDMRAVRQIWEEQWGSLSHFEKGNEHCLEGFFQPRGAKTNGKT